MIPDFIDDSSPPGEVKVYKKFQSSSNDWMVFHSLDLAPFNRHRRTEIDFVVLIPDVGLLCIEVKSHREIVFDGSWYPPSIKKSPFTQAQDARFALHRRLKDRLPTLANTPVVHCCIFPSAYFPVAKNLVIQPFEVMDKKRFDECSGPDDFCSKIKAMATLAIKHDPQLSQIKKSLTSKQFNDFLHFCYPIRKRRPERVIEREQRIHDLNRMLRVQQAPIINLTNFNSRTLVEGGAGTGKTLIGLEVARRKAEEGLRVGYLCFNQLIGKWIENELAKDQNPMLIAGSAYSVMMSLLGIDKPDVANQKFWSGLCLQIQDQLTDPKHKHESTFDYLILDEAQDILSRPDLMECLDLLIEGGFNSGSYLILGDFINQVLSSTEELKKPLNDIRNVSARWVLSENCRNYKAIGQVAMTLSMANESTYKGYMRAGGGLQNWELAIYNNDNEQINIVTEYIKKALIQDFRPEEISILSFGNKETSISTQLKNISEFRMCPAWMFEDSGIKLSTIPSYKGLENKVIIITDIFPNDSNFDRNRFYTGLTRATEKVLILCHESGKETLGTWITKKVNEYE